MLPRLMVSGGSSVVFTLPLAAGTVAHRLASDKRDHPTRRWNGKPVQELAYVPACDTRGDRFAAASAAWADAHGAVACTACFPHP